MLPLAKPRLIHFYVWWHKGKPVYVGQAADVEKRAKSHLRSKGPLGKFLRKHQGQCCHEMLDTHVVDVPQGRKSVAVENRYITYYGTRAPSGFNLVTAHTCSPALAQLGGLANARWVRDNIEAVRRKFRKMHREHPEMALAASRHMRELHRTQPEMAVKNGRFVGLWSREWARNHPDQAFGIRSAGGRASIAAGGGWKRAHRLHPGMAVEAGRKGDRKGKRLGGLNPKCRHVRWHVNRGIKNPNCKLCAESS